MRPALLVLTIISSLVISTPSPGAESDRLFTALLSRYVRDGMVDYKGLCADKRLDQYIAYLTRTDPEKLVARNEQIAFWINSYNAYTLKIICDHYPVKSINDLHTGGLILGTIFDTTIWDKELVTINQKKMTLNMIEHKILRARFKEPRIHFALVCASKSCAPLRSEAYEEDRLEEQLNDQGRTFLADQRKNYFDIRARIAHISKIFDWFQDDFGRSSGKVLEFIAQFLPEDIARSIRTAPGAWKIRYTDYDWNLNEQ